MNVSLFRQPHILKNESSAEVGELKFITTQSWKIVVVQTIFTIGI